MNIFQQALLDCQEEERYRKLSVQNQGVDFFSNDYLGLAASTSFKKLIDDHAERLINCNGSTGSRLLSGNQSFMTDIEDSIALFHGAGSATVYPSGYTANLGLLSCLGLKGVNIFSDELIHASLIDGIRMGKSNRFIYKHNDPGHLKSLLLSNPGENLVVTESVFSMDGDECPLDDLIQVCKAANARLIVDEAHAIGIYGNRGEGLVQAKGLANEVFARIITYGKAPGIHGATIVGPAWLKNYQVNFSRPLIFSTAPTPHQFAGIAAFYEMAPQIASERDALQSNVAYFLKIRSTSKHVWTESNTQIQSLMVAGNENAVALGNKIKSLGINALPIRSPSVPKGKERIRICLHSFNTKQEIDFLFKLIV